MNDFINSSSFQWVTIGFLIISFLICIFLAMLTTNTYFLIDDISAIRTELNIVAPNDVLQEVKNVKSSQLNRKDVQDLISNHAPWVSDRPEWERWKDSVDKRLEGLEEFVTDE